MADFFHAIGSGLALREAEKERRRNCSPRSSVCDTSAPGEYPRQAIKNGTPTGKIAEPLLKDGKLVPNNLVNDLIADLFRSSCRPERFVLDGYPRTLSQCSGSTSSCARSASI